MLFLLQKEMHVILFEEHNKHWESISDFERYDPQLAKLINKKIKYQSPLVLELPHHATGIFFVSGGRQIGKTTGIKQWIKNLILQNKIDPECIFYIAGELVAIQSIFLRDIFANYSKQVNYKRRIIIIDEINSIKNWDKQIKDLADSGQLLDVMLVITGSDSAFIREAIKLMPGRRGNFPKVDFHVYSLSFFETVRLKASSDHSYDENFFISELENGYAKHGGFLTAINDIIEFNKINPATYNTYSDWIRGDIMKRGKSEQSLREILTAIIKTYGSQITWNSLADHTSISHHDTIKQYVEILQDMDVLFVQDAIIEDKLLPAPKKAKKIIFRDPFIFHVIKRWVFGEEKFLDEEIPLMVETSVISQYKRFYEGTYYIKATGEVDIAYVNKGKFYPVEIKWRNQLRQKELSQIKKYKNGIVLGRIIEEGEIEGVKLLPLASNLYNMYIREKLDEITMGPYEYSTLLIDEQTKFIENILAKKTGVKLKNNINGYEYALGLYDVRFNKDWFDSKKFEEEILRKSILTEISFPEDGCIIVYFDENFPRHAGRVRFIDQGIIFVESKWGTFSNIFSHKVWHVPKSYGNSVKYFRLSKERLLDFLNNHASYKLK
jgi:predicted AAA+ superfamily ATPase